MTLFPKVESWIFGANIPGKKKTVCSTWRASAPTASSSRPSETTATKGSSSAERCAHPRGAGVRVDGPAHIRAFRS